MRDHRKLRAFEMADSLALAIYRHTRDFPDDERFGITSQMRRSAFSVVNNIVEGCARTSQREYVRFLEIAFASGKELAYQLTFARRLELGDSSRYGELESRANEVVGALGNLMARFNKPQSFPRPYEERGRPPPEDGFLSPGADSFEPPARAPSPQPPASSARRP